MAKQSTLLVLALLACLPSMADAERSRADDTLRISLGVSHDEADFEFEDTEATPDTRYTRLALELWSGEIPGLDVGITGGVGRLSQDDNPATEGDSVTGEFLGLMLGRDWSLAERLGLELRAEWVYHDLSGDDLDFEWFDAQGRAGLYTRAGRWRLASGATAGIIRGEQRSPDVTRDFDADNNVGAYVRAGLDTGRGGEISLSGELGNRDAVTLRFTRNF